MNASTADQLFPYLRIGPSRFARFDAEQISTQQHQVSGGGDTITLVPTNIVSKDMSISLADALPALSQETGVITNFHTHYEASNEQHAELHKLNDYLIEKEEDEREERDPAKKKQGGYCPDDKKVSKVSFEDEVETVKKNNPTLTDHEVRVVAAFRFRPKHRSHQESIKQEQSQEKKYTSVATFTLNDEGKLIYTHKGYEGTSIEDFSRRQLRLMPERYSLQDHQINMAIQDRFYEGATEVVTAYPREGEDNRDILVMEYDPETKVGIIRVVNTEVDGKIHTFDTLTTIAKEQFPQYDEFRADNGVFLLSDTAIDQTHMRAVIDDVETFATRELAKYEQKLRDNNSNPFFYKEEQPVAFQSINPLGREAVDVAQKLSHDTYDTITGIAHYIMEKRKKTDEKEDTALPLTGLLGGDKGIWKKIMAIPKDVREKYYGSVQEWREVIENFLGIPRAQSEQFLRNVQRTWTMMHDASRAIIIAYITNIGVGGTLAILESFAIFNVDTLSTFSDETQPVGLPEIFSERDGIIIFHSEEIENVIDQIVAKHHDVKSAPSKSKETNFSKQKEEPRGNEVVVGWVKELVQTFDKKTPQEAITIVEAEEQRVIQKTALLWEVLEEFMTKEAEKPIREFSFAIMVWTMMKLDSYLHILHSMKDTLAQIVLLMKDPETKTTMKQKASVLFHKCLAEGLVKEEGTSWLLFAIIWYLAMIREQGVVQVAKNQKPVKKKRAIPLKQLHPTGIIFAFQFVIE